MSRDTRVEGRLLVIAQAIAMIEQGSAVILGLDDPLLLVPTRPTEAKLGNPCHWQADRSHRPRYGTLEYAKQRLDTFYFYPKKILKRLHKLNRHRIKKEARRLAIVRIMKVILHYTDMRTLKIAIINQDKTTWMPTLTWLAEKAGLGLKRAQRAVHDLARAQYLKISYRWTQRKDGQFINKAALREIKPAFFNDLGLKPTQVDKDQQRAQFKISQSLHAIQKALETNNIAGDQYLASKALLRTLLGSPRGSPSKKRVIKPTS